MADPHPNALLIREFHERQNRFYSGGDQAPARAMLAEDVVWHVPGDSAIAGEHRGRDAVLLHFANRRALAHATFRIDVRGVLADDERAVILASGEVEHGGESFSWGTVGIFRLAAGRIAECWVVPYDQSAFDRIWSPAGCAPRGAGPTARR
jgi:uncharacterized protein